jgi:hypothetical protein
LYLEIFKLQVGEAILLWLAGGSIFFIPLDLLFCPTTFLSMHPPEKWREIRLDLGRRGRGSRGNPSPSASYGSPRQNGTFRFVSGKCLLIFFIKVYDFFLEIDRGRVTGQAGAPNWRRKFDNYYAYWVSGEYRHEWARLPSLLIVVPDESRAHAVRAVIVDRAWPYMRGALPAWIAIRDELDTHGVDVPAARGAT